LKGHYIHVEEMTNCPGSYGRWIYNYLCNQCLSSLNLWVRTLFIVRCTWYNSMW